MSEEEIFSFVQASMTLQENLMIDIDKLLQTLKNMLIKNIKMAHQIQTVIRQFIEFNPQSLGRAIDQT